MTSSPFTIPNKLLLNPIDKFFQDIVAEMARRLSRYALVRFLNYKKGNAKASGKNLLISIRSPAKAPKNKKLKTGAVER